MWRSTVLIVCFLPAWVGCAGIGSEANGADSASHAEAHKAVAREFLERLVNQGDMDAWPELVAGDTLMFNGEPLSPESAEQMRNAFRTILPDMHITVDEQIAEGDRVATRVTVTGTHLGDYMGLKASGQELSFGGMTFDRMRDGKIVETWHEMTLWGTLLMVSDD